MPKIKSAVLISIILPSGQHIACQSLKHCAVVLHDLEAHICGQPKHYDFRIVRHILDHWNGELHGTLTGYKLIEFKTAEEQRQASFQSLGIKSVEVTSLLPSQPVAQVVNNMKPTCEQPVNNLEHRLSHREIEKENNGEKEQAKNGEVANRSNSPLLGSWDDQDEAIDADDPLMNEFAALFEDHSSYRQPCKPFSNGFELGITGSAHLSRLHTAFKKLD